MTRDAEIRQGSSKVLTDEPSEHAFGISFGTNDRLNALNRVSALTQEETMQNRALTSAVRASPNTMKTLHEEGFALDEVFSLATSQRDDEDRV